jgi:hypothetical protein
MNRDGIEVPSAAGIPMPADGVLQTVTLNDGTEVEIRALTPAEASRVKPNFFTWDELTTRKVAAIAIVKPPGILDRNLSGEERDKIFRATGSAWLQGWIETKRSAQSPASAGPEREESHWISPRFSAETLQGDNDTIENRIAVYEDRLRGWLMKWAEYLNDAPGDVGRHAGFAVLQLALAYFEAHGVFLRGEDPSPRKAAEFFRAGVLHVFPELGRDDHKDSILEILWQDARNGLFHNGITLKRIRMEDDSARSGAFRYEADQRVLFVCQRNLVRRVVEHLHRYVERLRDPGEVGPRRNFQKAWNAVHRR